MKIFLTFIHKTDEQFRKYVNGVYRFFLVGIVTGNPSSCFPKTLPDVYNFVGNEKVSEILLICLYEIVG